MAYFVVWKGFCFMPQAPIAEVHSNRVLHRDLKPSNVMLTRPRGLLSRLGVTLLPFLGKLLERLVN